MEQEIEKVLASFSILILQVKNGLYYHTHIVERTIKAQNRLTNLIFEQILAKPGIGVRGSALLLERKIIDQIDVCLFYLIDKNGEMPFQRKQDTAQTAPLDIYLMNYIHDKLFEVIDFLDAYKDVVVPQWYEMITGS